VEGVLIGSVLLFRLARVALRTSSRLQARALAAQELSLELTLENGRAESASCFQRTIHLPVPLVDADVFLKLLQLDLKAHPPGAPVVKIRLRIEPAKPRPAQNGLFIPASPEPEKLELTLARIAGVVGEGRAGSPQLLDTHRPKAFEMQHFTPSAPNNGNSYTERSGNRTADFSPSHCGRRHRSGRQTISRLLQETKSSCRRSAMGSRPLAFLWRLVGAGFLGARRVGHRSAGEIRDCAVSHDPRSSAWIVDVGRKL
jgi:hypothetical protein